MENKKILEIKDIHKSFSGKEVLKGISMDIYSGERVAILGGNGAGKTTLVDMISQSTKPTEGEINFNIEGNLKQEIGMQYQEGEWPGGINASDMLRFYKAVFPNFNDERAQYLEEIFEISEFIKRPLRKLSGGQKQRFNAMLSVLNNPKIVILDELTTGLDMKLQFKIINFFKQSTIENEQTLLIVSHNPEEVETLCTRMVIIGDGKILLDKKIDEIKKQKRTVREIMEGYFESGVIDVK